MRVVSSKSVESFYKILFILLISIVVGIAYGDSNNAINLKENVRKQIKIKEKNRIVIEKYFDLEKGSFKGNLSDKQKQEVYDNILDSLVENDSQLYRFNRNQLVPSITTQIDKQIAVIEAYADQCKTLHKSDENSELSEIKKCVTSLYGRTAYNYLVDQLVKLKNGVYRVNGNSRQETFVEGFRKEQERIIQEVADRCVNYIGEELEDRKNKMLSLTQDETLRVISLDLPDTQNSKEVLLNIQPSYLEGRVKKCTDFTYGRPYSLANFEYYDYEKKKTPKERKQYWIDETLYDELYIYIREAGLLRKIPSAYYPKSFIRKHADSSGLTNYIKQKQKEANRQLNHEVLAMEFFGSREVWLKKLENYIDLLTRNKIGRNCLFNYIDNSNLVGYPSQHGELCFRFKKSDELLDYKDELKNRMHKVFDFKNKFFYPNISSEQKQQFEIDYYELYSVITDEQLYRFYRREQQPVLKKIVQDKLWRDIQQELDQCDKIFNLKPDHSSFPSKHIEVPLEDIKYFDFVAAIQDHPLNKQVLRCIKNIYKDQGKIYTPSYCEFISKKLKNNFSSLKKEEIINMESKCPVIYSDNKDYSLTNFEYFNLNKKLSEFDIKRKNQAEQLYQNIYLKIKKAGLLRKIPSAYYPKSLVRDHANKSGLTDYIYQKEKLANQPLNHEKLAMEYYGSREKWVKALNQFINEK